MPSLLIVYLEMIWYFQITKNSELKAIAPQSQTYL